MPGGISGGGSHRGGRGGGPGLALSTGGPRRDTAVQSLKGDGAAHRHVTGPDPEPTVIPGGSRQHWLLIKHPRGRDKLGELAVVQK